MTRRPSGHGTIEPLRSGRFRARVPLADGVRHTVGTFDTEDEAEAMVAAFVEEAAAKNLAPVGGVTFRAVMRAWLEDLELSRSYVAMPNARSLTKNWIETAPFADWPARRVTRQALERWARSLAGAGLGSGSSKQAVGYVRRALALAARNGRIDANPAADLKLPREQARTSEPWTYLDPAEQQALLACPAIPAGWRLRIAFAMGTGLRFGELVSLRLADLHVDGEHPRVVVRFGSRRRAPKSRKIREVPLWGMALEAAREQLRRLEGQPNDHRLVFPGERGGFEKVSRVPDWRDWLDAAGIERRVRWHDLRHTTGASLISGWWGRAWSLVEVRDLLGHHSVKMTERYAHLGPNVLRTAAAGTTGPRLVHPVAQAEEIAGAGFHPRHPPRKYAKQLEKGAAANPEGFAWTSAEPIAEELLRAARAGEDCGSLVVALCGAVLGSEPVRLAGAALAGGPHALDRALELAALVLSARADAFASMGAPR